MDLSKDKRKFILRNMKEEIEESEYMFRETINLDTLSDEDLKTISDAIGKLWYVLYKLS